MAFCLGAGASSDALMIALKIPNSFRRIFAEGAFNASFLPRFSKVLNKEGQNGANVFMSDVFSALLLILVPFSIVIIAIFPSFLTLFVSGFDALSEKFGLTVALGRICFPYLIFISLASLFCGVLNAIDKFALPAAVFSLLNVFTATAFLIGYFLDLSHASTVRVAAWFVLLSGIAQSYFVFASAVRHGFSVRFRFHCFSSRVKSVMKNMIPGIIGAGVWQLNMIVDTTISSYLPTGTITCVNVADRLNQFPLGTLGIALGSALLPSLSRFVGRKEYDKTARELENGMAFAFFPTLFATVVLTALSEQTTSVAFQRGMFGIEQVKVAASILAGFAVGLPAYTLTKAFSVLYFAAGDTRSPVIFGMISVFLNAVLLVFLVPIFKYFGLALCSSLSAVANAAMLIYFIRRKMPIKFSKAFWHKIASQTTASFAAYFSMAELADLYWRSELGEKAIKWLVYSGFLACGAAAFAATAIAYLYLMKQEWRLWKKKAW
jgi:putative peptidoglycan lipid II flippase